MQVYTYILTPHAVQIVHIYFLIFVYHKLYVNIILYIFYLYFLRQRNFYVRRISEKSFYICVHLKDFVNCLSVHEQH